MEEKTDQYYLPLNDFKKARNSFKDGIDNIKETQNSISDSLTEGFGKSLIERFNAFVVKIFRKLF